MKLFASLLGAAALLFASASRADLLYRIDIDTSSLAGVGFIELSLGGLADAPSAHAILTSSTGNAFGAVVDQFGQVSGELGSTLSLASELGFADLLQEVSFGDSLALQLQLTGAWLDAIGNSGLTFAIKLWSAEFSPLLTRDEFGDLLRLELMPGGFVQSDIFSDYVSVQPEVLVPNPASMLLVLIGGLALLHARRRSRKH